MAGALESKDPQYAREVFERLRDALDVLFTGDALIAWEDSCIKPNYDFREDGAWLRPNSVEDTLNWTPACELAEAPNSPDPLSTPALPFPFTARHLAAFMLDGWGWFLHERFAGEDRQADPQMVRVLLGGVRDAKPREAIAGAFSALAMARQLFGEPDATLADAEHAAKRAFDEATERAEQLHDWREGGLTEPERTARLQRCKELTAAACAAWDCAQAVRVKHDNDRRKNMVQWLLCPPKGMLPGELSGGPRSDDKVTQSQTGRAPDLTPQEVAQGHVGWYDATIRANYWVGLQSVTATEAAQLLSCSNPQDPASANWLETTTVHMNPAARRELLRGLRDEGGTRPLMGWLQIAKSRGWRYDPWIDQYIEDARIEPTAESVDAPAVTRAVSRARAQEIAILAKFMELRIDAMRLPRPKPGKSSAPVAKVRAELGYTSDVMQKAMTRLFEDGRAAYSETPAD